MGLGFIRDNENRLELAFIDEPVQNIDGTHKIFSGEVADEYSYKYNVNNRPGDFLNRKIRVIHHANSSEPIIEDGTEEPVEYIKNPRFNTSQLDYTILEQRNKWRRGTDAIEGATIAFLPQVQPRWLFRPLRPKQFSDVAYDWICHKVTHVFRPTELSTTFSAYVYQPFDTN